MFEKIFKLKDHGTNCRIEIMAGITTFLTMSYIIVVNPAILSLKDIAPEKGIPVAESTVATIIAAIVGSLIMAFYANRPIAIAPYMGENAFIAFTVILGLGYSWQDGITGIFIGGVLFVIITALKLRSWLADAVPTNLKFSFVVGIGLFLTFIGLIDTGIVVKTLPGVAVPVSVGKLTSPEVLLALFAFLVMSILMIKRIRGAIIIGIVSTTALAFLLKYTGVPFSESAGINYPEGIISMPPSVAPIAFQFNFSNVFTLGFLPVLLTVFLMDFVDTMGTLIGVSARAGFLDKDGNLPEIEKPMMADAVATVVGACVGTTTTGSYIESAAGIEEGGRTGMTAFTTAILFGLALFFTPVLTVVPRCAYGPALIIVGILMIDSAKKINYTDLTELIPAFATIILMSFTYNLGIGITAGLVLYPLIKLITGRASEVNAGTWILGAISLIFYIAYPYA